MGIVDSGHVSGGSNYFNIITFFQVLKFDIKGLRKLINDNFLLYFFTIIDFSMHTII